MLADALVRQWTRDAAAPLEGWDFSYLRGRLIETKPDWDYLALARTAVAQSREALDLATGGGEVLSSLAPFPGRATAVEGYAPNLPVARKRLSPLGIEVLHADPGAVLPFQNGAFDLVLNRHGAFAVREMDRVLRTDGVFLTQQVGADNLADLGRRFGAEPKWSTNTLGAVKKQLQALGFDVRQAEDWRGPVTFLDVGALVYFLKAIPWIVDDFGVESHLNSLAALQAQIESGRPLQFTETRFLIHAVKA
jgi:SAM-dependent methyltransferase